jgi:hypothetical protein
MAQNEEIDRFIGKHKTILALLDIAGGKGECMTAGSLKEQTGATTEEIKMHNALSEIDLGTVQPVEGLTCSRRAIGVLERKLEAVL